MSRLRWEGASGAALLLLVGMLAFGNVFGNGWHYDDVHSITQNPHLRSLDAPLRFLTDPTQFSRDADKAMFRPLLLLSFALNYAWSGLDTGSWHAVNLALHLAGALVLWRILLSLGRTPGVAWAGAALFALHPLATEPVNYISSRSESLAALCVLIAFWQHLRARHGQVGGRAASVAAFGLGLLAKSVAIATPVLLLAHDGLRDGWRRAGAPRRWWPYLVVAAVYLAVVGGHLTRAVVSDAVRGPWAQLATQAKAGPYYLWLLASPVHLSIHHQFFEGGRLVVVVLALALVVSLAWRALRAAPRDVRLGLLWAAAALAPTVVVPLNVLVNEHRLYLPLAGLVIAVTALHRPRRRAVGTGAILAVVAVLGITAHQRNRVWETDYSLWSDAAAKAPSPEVPVAWVQLGTAAKQAGRLQEAARHYRRALQIRPGHVAARNNLGIVLQQLGQVDAAIEVFAEVTRDEPDLGEGWYNLGKAYQQRAAARQPEIAAAALDTEAGVAAVSAARADYERARRAYRRVGADNPNYHVVLNNLGTVFELSGRPDSAVVYYRRSLDRQPGFTDAERNVARLSRELPARAQALLAQGQLVMVAQLCEALLAPGPSRAQGAAERDALLFLAAVRLYQGRLDESLAANRRLVRDWPDFGEGYLQLGNLHETAGQPEAAAAAYRQLLAGGREGPLADEARRRLRSLETAGAAGAADAAGEARP